MESIVVYDSKPSLKDPIFIECLPGIGNVGKETGDFLAGSLKAKKFATIYSKNFPSQAILDNENIIDMTNNQLWYSKDVNGRDVIFLIGAFQCSTHEGQFELCREIMSILLDYKISEIITLGGYGTGQMVEAPRVFGAVTDLKIKKEYAGYGVEFPPGEPSAGIIGASGVFLGLGKIYSVPSICLMGETSGYFVDHKSAMAVVKILIKKLGVELDLKELIDKSEQIDEITAKIKEVENRNCNCRDLGYIG
ncbi:PAC2 family protein [Candidatus Methanoplasma termitum]|uniref:PAC2 family protein n=1 Tax=Candidatus Methanoplasma termitum TaxID=1577791 RepID=A0A0A7LCQ2_9ARCH|nr:proteasome assembly chaperone family protein [Candidatus Methanoplasma termitum]AIZ56950.1 PAC2 family protein [Candidatus Methanoplasma termitum]MCL2333264.1 proteasome assembly chaperone family protein [Candidatus Methanoplasma sp.]